MILMTMIEAAKADAAEADDDEEPSCGAAVRATFGLWPFRLACF